MDDLTYEGSITNPMRGLFLLGGSLPRKPGQYLMNNQGPYRTSKTVPVATGETIHFSVRVLLGTGLRSCPTLSKYSTKIEQLDGETTVGWHLHSKSVSHTKIDLPEEPFSDFERRLLESWMGGERRRSSKVHVSSNVHVSSKVHAWGEVHVSSKVPGILTTYIR